MSSAVINVPQSAELLRITKDVEKLMENNHAVSFLHGIRDFCVKFHGPAKTPYQNGVWNIHVILSDNYPYTAPQLEFLTKIYHPNICERTGYVSLNQITLDWSPIYDLTDLFERFLPELFRRPTVSEAFNFNPHASAYFKHYPEAFKQQVIQHVKLFAMEDDKSDPE